MLYTSRYRSHHDAAQTLKKKFTMEISAEAYLEKKLLEKPQKPLVLYLHVPFCNKICSFCPFHRPDKLQRRFYHEYLIEEIRAIRHFPFLQGEVGAINFGGGTPTALLPEQMKLVLKELRNSFRIREDAEISLESSATELSDAMLEVLVENGVNRLSIGIQTFQDEVRKQFGRRGSGEFAASRVKRAMEYGITNTNIDLLYRYPNQTDEQLRDDLRIIRELGIAGLSFYALRIHENTPLYNRLSEEEKARMENLEREYALYNCITEELAKDGFEALELTKLVRNHLDKYEYMALRHGGGSCIAIGQGAGGCIDGYYYRNPENRVLISEKLPFSRAGRVVAPEFKIYDDLIYQLQKGRVNLGAFSERLGRNLEDCLKEKLERLTAEGLLESCDGEIVMTNAGRFWGNNIVDELLRRITEEL